MRNLLIGVLVGLAAGIAGALAYSHYLGEGQQLVQAQTELDSAKSSVAQHDQEAKYLKSENEALGSQIQQLISKNEAIKTQLASVNPTSAPPAAANPMAGLMKMAVAQQYQQKLQMLKSRLHLTPDQEEAVKAALDEESQHVANLAAQAFQGGKIDATQAANDAASLQSLQKTLDDILTPEQKAEYAQMQSDEKNSATETVASAEMNQLAPVLQLSEAQKDQVYSALYQDQLNAQDPTWIKNNIPSGSDAASVMQAEARAKEDSLSQILTPSQMTAYHQQAQSQLDLQKAMIEKMAPSGTTTPGTVSTTVTVTPGP